MLRKSFHMLMSSIMAGSKRMSGWPRLDGGENMGSGEDCIVVEVRSGMEDT